MVSFGWPGGGLYDKVNSGALIATQTGLGLTSSTVMEGPLWGEVTVSQGVYMNTAKSTVDYAKTAGNFLWCRERSESAW